MSDNGLNEKIIIGGRKIVPFVENALYDVKQVAAIMGRSQKYVRNICHRGVIRCRRERGGYTISGWAIRQYAEGCCELENSESRLVK